MLFWFFLLRYLLYIITLTSLKKKDLFFLINPNRVNTPAPPQNLQFFFATATSDCKVDKNFVEMLLFGVVVALLGTPIWALSSPCVDLFQYESTSDGKWSGSVKLLSDADLHGVWIRLIFDGKLTELKVADNFGQVITDNNEEFLVKNRDYLLKALVPTTLKIEVKYEGKVVPNLMGFRLNAKMVCPIQQIVSQDFFTGDLTSPNLLTNHTHYQAVEHCGSAAIPEAKWPWHAALFIQDKYICGATLISSKHLVTAAHCVSYKNIAVAVSPQQLEVHLGKDTKVKVSRVVLYPGYVASTLLNDVAVVELDQSVTVTDYVRPICLTGAHGTEGFLVGYGITQGRQIEDLAETRVKIINGDDCATQQSELGDLLNDNVICANFAQENAVCVGDSGSALMTLRPGPKSVWQLSGIVSVGAILQGHHKCNPSNSALVQDLSSYKRWIQSVIS